MTYNETFIAELNERQQLAQLPSADPLDLLILQESLEEGESGEDDDIWDEFNAQFVVA